MSRRKPKPVASVVVPHVESADKQRRHFFRLLTFQNVAGALAIIITVVAAFYRLETRVSVDAQRIGALESQQRATWDALREIRRR